MFNPYTKAVLGALLAMLTALVAGVEDGTGLSSSEIASAVLLFFGGLAAVWAAHAAIKWLAAGAMAAGSAVVVALQDGGISTQEWLIIAVAGMTSLVAIYATPNTPASNNPRVL
jgi:hypothetical protein